MVTRVGAVLYVRFLHLLVTSVVFFAVLCVETNLD